MKSLKRLLSLSAGYWSGNGWKSTQRGLNVTIVEKRCMFATAGYEESFVQAELVDKGVKVIASQSTTTSKKMAKWCLGKWTSGFRCWPFSLSGQPENSLAKAAWALRQIFVGASWSTSIMKQTRKIFCSQHYPCPSKEITLVALIAKLRLLIDSRSSGGRCACWLGAEE